MFLSFYFNLFSLHFLSGHKQLYIFFLNIDIFQKHIFSFNRFQKQPFFLNIFLEAAARSLKKTEMFLEAATHLPQHKKYQLHIFLSEAVVHGFCTKYIQKQLHKSSRLLNKIYSEAVAQIFTVSAQNVHSVEDFS